MKIKLLFPILLICASLSGSAQEVLTLKDGELPGTGTLTQLKWLTGYYTGSGLGGDCDELWSPIMDNSMQGVFRYADNGVLVFSEFMILEELEETVTLKIKHFNKDLTAWEEKEKWTIFELIKIEDNIVYFDGITYAKNSDELIIKLIFHEGGKSWIEEFKFKQTELK